jgi:integrase/recombinase XerD
MQSCAIIETLCLKRIHDRRVKEKVLREQVDRFLGHLKDEKEYSANTLAAYRNDLNQFVAFLQQAMPESVSTWAEVDDQLIRGYGEHLGERNYASSTVARKVASVKSFFAFLVDKGLLTANPTAVLNAPRVEKRLPRILSVEELESLLAQPAEATTPKALRDRALLDLLCATGMRVSEVVSLRLDDLDVEASQIVCMGRDTKTRQLPLTPQAHQSLTLYLEKGREALLRDQTETTFFLNHRGRPLTRQGLWLIIKSYAEAAGIGQDVTPHTLRHSFAAHRLEGGSDLQQVRELLGHANVSTTQVYTHIVGRAAEASKADLA